MAEKKNDTVRENGYIYGPRTKAGFLRMQRLGIPRPLFRMQDKYARLIRRHLEARLVEVLKQYAQAAKESGMESVALTQDGIVDSLLSLLGRLLEWLKKLAKPLGAEETAMARTAVGAANYRARRIWEKSEWELSREYAEDIKRVLLEEQEDYLSRLRRDESEEMSRIVAGFSIDKRKLYNDNMEALRLLYLDQARYTLTDYDNALKQMFLEELEKYVTGETDTLDIRGIVEKLQMQTKNMGRFFARDQMQRFNKATTLAQFGAAGVTKVRWCTCRDGRVRATHKALDGRVFPIDELPQEINDYNCRCGLIPEEYAD